MTALEIDAVEGRFVGRDPRQMSVADLAALGIEVSPILSVIREKCLDCCGGQQSEVRRCTAIKCALWPYRMNHNPFRSRELTEEQRLAAAERLAKAREARAA